MATGFFLYHLDKTTCGGHILSGASDDTYTIGGVVRQQVRVGDPVICGKHKGRFRVCGGMGDTYSVDGAPKEWAGSLDSFSSCPCRARFIPSVYSHSYQSDCNAGRVAERELERARAASQAEHRTPSDNPDSGVDTDKPAPVPVFAKSCLRGAGCTDAGTEEEPQSNFAAMSFYQSLPPEFFPSSPATSSEPEQFAQAAKKKRSLFDKVTGFFFGETQAMPLPPPPIVMGGGAEAGMAASVGGATEKLNQDAAKALEYRMKRLSGPEVWESRFELNLPFVVMGAVLHSMLKGEKEDLLTADKLLEAARNNSAVPTRVRYNWVGDPETGRLKAIGYHTPPESGRDQVRVRLMEKWFDGKYRFWGDGPGGKVRITWTPANVPGSSPDGWDTGNEGPQAGTVTIPGLEHPDTGNVTITTLPVPEEKDFRDYILVFPGNVHPPIYIYLSKPPVELLEVELYSDFKRRSRQGIYEADHMPSAAAVRAALLRDNPRLRKHQLDAMVEDVAAIVIPKKVHQKISETYGRRNSPAQIALDTGDLRAAVDRNLDAIKPALKEHGSTESQIEEARVKLHKLNSKVGLYK